MISSLPKILLTGADGQLGLAIRKHIRASQFEILTCSHSHLDITNSALIKTTLKQFSPHVVINTAAYTAVDLAEAEVKKAMAVNQKAVKNLASTCETLQIPLIHLSTDYIFDGNKKTPYQETDTANPLNTYGLSKWLGEQEIRKHCEKHLILRVSGIFSEHRKNFLKTILDIAQKQKTLKIVHDQFTCPTYAGDIADAIFSMAGNISHFGTYHFCNEPYISWYDFAKNIIEIAKKYHPLQADELISVSLTDYKTPAKRPAYSVLSCKKIERDYKIQTTHWQKTLSSIIPSLLNKGFQHE